MITARSVYAVAFSSIDARSMGMGGTGVASATSANAVFFNPALLATYSERKELAKNSYMGTLVSGSLSKQLFTFEQLQRDDYQGELKKAIRSYNSTNSATNAQFVVTASENLQQALDDIAPHSLNFDIHASTVIGVVSKNQGGSFFIDSRIVGGGAVDLTPTDQQLLSDYILGMKYVASNGTQGEARPALFNQQGQLRDLTGTLSSIMAARGAFITETGVAVAGNYTVLGHRLKLGVTPKVVFVSVFDYLEKASDVDLGLYRDWNRHDNLNVDLGAIYDLNDKWRAGLVVKNIFARHHTTRFDNEIEIRQQWRAGVLYRSNLFLAAADLDLIANKAIAFEEETQYLSFGLESDLKLVLARVGYRHNLVQLTKAGNVTLGLGLKFANIICDFAYMQSSNERAAALQLGARF